MKQTSSEIDEKVQKYESVVDEVSQISHTFTAELNTIRNEFSGYKESTKIALGELSDIMQNSIETAKTELSEKSGTETKEIAKHFFKMDKEMKTLVKKVDTADEILANMRGKVELTKARIKILKAYFK